MRTPTRPPPLISAAGCVAESRFLVLLVRVLCCLSHMVQNGLLAWLRATWAFLFHIIHLSLLASSDTAFARALGGGY
jgi:hypothetical protein